ncbi:MAG: MBL fold metallo-hydrolase [Candidatus Peregrinibacteria bacterium]|nr:MBL fold metallo-hydrolase [Candidatus Peregrinibacteria bacterium]MDZ4244578.1 MBL fold metallo-hydrolase [Candidatus Gracilibacteria bacterium]
MQITFIGANHTVTGSKYLIEINGKSFIMECGMHQGRRKESEHRNNCFPFDVKGLDAVVLSHAHIDHSGNLPNLVNHGYEGPIYSTHATKDLCQYMLTDSGRIQESNVEYINKRKEKRGQELIEPIYTEADAINAISYFKGQNYYESFDVVDGVKCTFYDAGHILGSAMIFLEMHDFETDEKVSLLFTGDLGRPHLPILRDPDIEKLPPADILMIESTYGNKFHESIVEAQDALAKIINETAAKGGKIIIPAFALGRTQEVTYELHQLANAKRIPAIPIFLDSPLAVSVTGVFKAHPECYDEESKKMIEDGSESLLGFDNFKQTKSVEESKELNNFNGPCIIISASGMCEHGRILHHLKNNIEDPRNAVMIVGYQAENTLGRKLVKGETVVSIFDKDYQVKARIEALNYFSGHADRSDLLNFATSVKGLKRTFVVHGDAERSFALKEAFESNELSNVCVPSWGEVYDLNLKALETGGKPKLRIMCGGEYIYDAKGILAPADVSHLGGDGIPDHEGKNIFAADNAEEERKAPKKEDKKAKTSGFDSGGFDS